MASGWHVFQNSYFFNPKINTRTKNHGAIPQLVDIQDLFKGHSANCFVFLTPPVILNILIVPQKGKAQEKKKIKAEKSVNIGPKLCGEKKNPQQYFMSTGDKWIAIIKGAVS